MSQKRRLTNIYRRDYDFDIAFFPAANSIDSFYKWEEEMLQRFDILHVDDENSYHVKDVSIARVDSIWHYTFSVSFFVREIIDTAAMEDLEMEGLIIDGSEGK